MRILAITLLCVLALAACDSHKKPDTLSYMIYSPNGEPLNGGPLGRLTCAQAMDKWLSRVSGGSGHVTKAAFLSDAQTQFIRMDIDHNGYIVSEELDRFRDTYRKQQSSQSTGHGHKSKGGASGGPSDPSLSASDPVMSADTNLDFKVTPQEFMKQADDNFTKLDVNHDGFIDRSELNTLCDTQKE